MRAGKRPHGLRPTHAEFIEQIVQLGHLLGWAVAFFRPARTMRGWRTPVGGDGQGWFDLVLVRERVIFAEIKIPPDKLTPAQEEWLRRYERAGQECYVWTWHEQILEEIEGILRRSNREALRW